MSTEQAPKVEEIEVADDRLDAGSILKQKRLDMGLSQRDVADQLKLRLVVIERIENNQFEFGQVATFVRGYLRSYARVVGADENLVLDVFDQEVSLASQEQTMHSFSGKTKRKKHDGRLMLLTWSIFAIIIGISSVWWWQNQTQDTLRFSDFSSALSVSGDESDESAEPSVSDQDSAAATTLNATASSSVNDDVTMESAAETNATRIPTEGLETIDASENGDETASDSAVNETDAAEATASALSLSTPNHAPQENTTIHASSTALQLSFDADCWVQITDATGKTLLSGVKASAQSVMVQGQPPYHVVLGAPENVSMTFASEPVDLSGYTSGKVARFTLP